MSVGEIKGRENGRARSFASDRFNLSFRSLGVLAASGDFAIIVASALFGALVYHTLFLRIGIDVGRYAAIGGICFVNFLAIGVARKSYQADALLRFRHQTREVFLTWALVAMLSLSLIFVAKVAGDISRGAVGFFFLIGLLTLLVWRRLLKLWIAKAIESGSISMRQIILIADHEELSQTNAVLRIKEAGYSATSVQTFGPNPSDSSLADIAAEAIRVTRQQPIDSIMLLTNWRDIRIIDQIINALRVVPLSIHLLPDHQTARLIQDGTTAIAGVSIAELQRAPLSIFERSLKRVFDIVLALGGIIVLSPLFAIVALLIKIESSGPVFFRQKRIGFSGRAFRIFKFRSMTVVEDDDHIRQATRGDPRVTRLGRWLRKTNIDELPQLWNVVRGDMSLVGPRPHAVAHDVEYQKRIGSYAFRHHVKPGLTGWAQVNGLRGETKTVDQMERRVEYDLYYINHWSFLLDISIVLLTVRDGFRDPAAF